MLLPLLLLLLEYHSTVKSLLLPSWFGKLLLPYLIYTSPWILDLSNCTCLGGFVNDCCIGIPSPLLLVFIYDTVTLSSGLTSIIMFRMWLSKGCKADTVTWYSPDTVVPTLVPCLNCAELFLWWHFALVLSIVSSHCTHSILLLYHSWCHLIHGSPSCANIS